MDSNFIKNSFSTNQNKDSLLQRTRTGKKLQSNKLSTKFMCNYRKDVAIETTPGTVCSYTLSSSPAILLIPEDNSIICGSSRLQKEGTGRK